MKRVPDPLQPIPLSFLALAMSCKIKPSGQCPSTFHVLPSANRAARGKGSRGSAGVFCGRLLVRTVIPVACFCAVSGSRRRNNPLAGLLSARQRTHHRRRGGRQHELARCHLRHSPPRSVCLPPVPGVCELHLSAPTKAPPSGSGRSAGAKSRRRESGLETIRQPDRRTVGETFPGILSLTPRAWAGGQDPCGGWVARTSVPDLPDP